MRAAAFSFLAEIGIPDARQCLTFAGPFLALAAAWWLINRADYFIARVFPQWKWEQDLGWLNIRAEKRAERWLRWIGYLCYVVLAGALYGIVWSAQALPALRSFPDDPDAMKELSTRLPILLVSLGLWFVYLGCSLLPKLRSQFEEEDLEKFRAEQLAMEEEHAAAKASRGMPGLTKPRITLTPSLRDRRRGPGD